MRIYFLSWWSPLVGNASCVPDKKEQGKGWLHLHVAIVQKHAIETKASMKPTGTV